MKIRLISDTPGAFGLPSILPEHGESILIQTDWKFPAVASAFGWSIQLAQWPIADSDNCQHDGTDGTVPCAKCGFPASKFIQSARAWIDDNDGTTIDDPGYFTLNPR